MKSEQDADTVQGCQEKLSIPEYLLGRMAPAAEAAFEKHLSGCSECAGELEAFKLTLQTMQAAPTANCSPGFTRRVLDQTVKPEPKTIRSLPLLRGFYFPSVSRVAALWLALAAVGALIFISAQLARRTPSPVLSKQEPQPAAKAYSRTETLNNAANWLVTVQQKDGSWNAGQAGDYSTGVSSLALLALMEADHSPLTGRHADAINRGLEHLVEQQDQEGLIGPRVSIAPYNHGLATLALINAARTDSSGVWRNAAENGIEFILKAQLPNGGWGYLPSESEPANSSASIWPLQALIEANALGYEGLRPAIDKGLAWLQSTVSRDGFMGYTKSDDLRYGGDTMTAAALVCFLKDGSSSQRPAVAALLPAFRQIVARQDSSPDFYKTFFVSRAVGLAPDDKTAGTLTGIAGKLASLQQGQGPSAGSWTTTDPWSQGGGSVYSTAMASLALK